MFDAVRGLASGLSGVSGVSTRVFGLADDLGRADRNSWGDTPVSEFHVRGPRSFGYAPGLLPALLDANLDLLHLHGLWTYLSRAAVEWRKKTGKEVIVSPHGMLDPWALNNSRLKKVVASALYENKSLRGATCIHALCGSEAEAIRVLGLRNPLAIIPNGVELPGEKNVCEGPAWAKNLPDEAQVLFYLGRLHPKKNLKSLLRAWEKIALDHSAARWWLVIAGWDQAGHMRELVAAARGLPRVVFPGPQFGTEKHESMCRADAFVLPSVSEGLPLSVLEAWAFGLPVLMTLECNLREGFDAGAAIQIGPTPDGIAKGIAAVIQADVATRRGMGDRGRRLVASRYTWPMVAERMHQVYRWMKGSRGPTPDLEAYPSGAERLSVR